MCQDKNPDDPSAAQKFQEMAAAYEILSEPSSRKEYDTHGMAGLGGHGMGETMDAADLFAQFFPNGPMFSFPPGKNHRNGGQDSVIPYDVTLEDLYNGKHVKMNMEKDVECSQCKGSGARGNAKRKQCSTCEGRGWSYSQTQISPTRLGNSRIVCPECDGEGEKLREKDRCKKCKGERKVKEKTRQEIFIDKGMTDKQRIVLAGAGDQEPGHPAGDVIFVLKAAPHDSFERSGNDLLTHAEITLSEALLGFSRILITHLDGRGIKVTSPKGKIIKPGEAIVLRGEGMPVYRNPDQKGSLYIILDVQMPTDEWLKTADAKALEAILPPKKEEMNPLPQEVDEADYEESDLVEVRARSFPASSDFFDQGFTSQFGEREDDWEDEDNDDEYDDPLGREPECRTQ